MTSSEEITTLTFTPDSPCNTTITSPSGKVLYRVETPDPASKHPVTTVSDAADEVIATLEWHEMTSDKVILRGREPMSFSDWVKKSRIPLKE